jgi:hypothetical protein
VGTFTLELATTGDFMVPMVTMVLPLKSDLNTMLTLLEIPALGLRLYGLHKKYALPVHKLHASQIFCCFNKKYYSSVMT